MYKGPEHFPETVRKIRKRLRTRMTTEEMASNAEHLQAVVDVLEAMRGPVYLYGFDDFTNLGDQALWQSLDRLASHLPGHIRVSGLLAEAPFSDSCRYEKAAILFPGGGSLGNRYTSSLRRIKAIEAMHPHTIVQMPVSTTFADPGELSIERVAQAYAAPPESCVFVRDVTSRADAADRLGIEARLVRDLTAFLPDMHDLKVGGQGLLLLLRKDQEASSDRSQMPGAGVIADWDDMDAKHTLELRAARILFWRILRHLPLPLRDMEAVTRLRMWAAGTISEIETARALAFLAGFDQIITDRLHGVLLSRKLGLTGCMLDNDHGKLSRYFQTWEEDGFTMCPDLETALQKVAENGSDRGLMRSARLS